MPDGVLHEVYERLHAAFGPQRWWPGDSPTEVAIGAVLTQNTAWTNVEKAIIALKQRGCLDFARIRGLDEDDLADIIRSAGTFRIKARRLRALADWVHRRGGTIEAALKGETARVRKSLLGVDGIGPETADAILLYAGGHAVFVVDAYTRRVLRRHGLLGGDDSYADVQGMFAGALPRDAVMFNEYHALLVAVGKQHCRALAKCDGCPLEHLPHDEGL